MGLNMLQFSIPGVAAEAMNVRQLALQARKAGVSVGQFTYHFAYRDSGDGNGYRCRVMCSAPMAVFLIEQLRVTESDARGRGEAEVAAACSRGIRETYTAIMAPQRKQLRGRAPSGGARGIGAGGGRG